MTIFEFLQHVFDGSVCIRRGLGAVGHLQTRVPNNLPLDISRVQRMALDEGNDSLQIFNWSLFATGSWHALVRERLCSKIIAEFSRRTPTQEQGFANLHALSPASQHGGFGYSPQEAYSKNPYCQKIDSQGYNEIMH